MRRTLVTTAALVAAFFMPVNQAQAQTEPVLSGYGWQTSVVPIWSLDSDYPYTLNFGSEAARDRLLPHAVDIAAQLREITGLVFIVSPEVRPVPQAERSCATHPFHEITLGYKHQPTGVEGMSVAHPCYATGDHSAWGGWLYIDSEYWTVPNWFSEDEIRNESYRKNVVTHEVGHVAGLGHPNINGEPYHCVEEGVQPVMCSPIGGYLHQANAGKYTSYDRNGLRQLVANEEE